MFRSVLRRDRRLFIPDEHRRRRDGQLLFVLRLISHLTMTSVVFLAVPRRNLSAPEWAEDHAGLCRRADEWRRPVPGNLELRSENHRR